MWHLGGVAWVGADHLLPGEAPPGVVDRWRHMVCSFAIEGRSAAEGAGSERMPHYVLPDLDYDYAALEPHISGAIMEEHHGKHHKAYVGKANETLEKLDQARETDDFTRIAGLERALAFNLSGHVLHSIFWK